VNGDFRIGPWLVQPGLNIVSRNGTDVRLEPKLMEVLLCLADQVGEPLSKEKLLRAVWPNTFVSDDVLTRSIFELRRVFEDDARESKFIQTIPKRGYRLVASVESVNGSVGRTADVSKSSDSPRDAISSRRNLQIGIAIGIAISLMLLTVFAVMPAEVWRKLAGKAVAPQIRSIAVLPLHNLSGDPSQEYFADGMTEELITDLSQISALTVISHTSVDTYKKSSKSLPEIARELHVDGVVEGSVMRSGDKIRITAQLIYAPEDKNLWAKSYDHDLRDVLALQASIASAIADEIQVKLTPGEQARLHTPRFMSLKAHEAYLQGTYYLRTRGSAEAIQFFQQALQEEPSARGYVGLARAYSEQAGIGADPRSVMPQAKAAAMKALELDDTLADAHLVLAEASCNYDWDWSRAENQFKRALELNPSAADAHEAYALFLDAMGRLDEGKEEHLRAQEVDPLNEHMHEVFYHNGQYDRAIEVLRNYVEREPGDVGLHWQLGITYGLKGMYKEAIGEWEQMFAVSGYEDQYGLARDMHRGYARSGYKGALRDVLKRLEGIPPKEAHVPPRIMVEFYMFLGDKDRALAWLERAHEERDSIMIELKTAPDYLPAFRSDPRFQNLIRRVGLPQ
jgi:TolB-like protein/DNA-binding winged helix-turn-helix (wHTH) protein/Flp pilus assembly protein TadD